MSGADSVRPTVTPQALLLDFGGVVAETTRRETWSREVAEIVHGQLEAAGCLELSVEDVLIDLLAGCAADKAWKDAMSRPAAPEEMTHRRFWGEFVAADWPLQAREIVIAHATWLCQLMGERRSERRVRPGIPELLAAAEERDIPVAIVSNALAGVVHRDFIADHDLTHRFALQVYSDEVGLRKPNPELIWMACRALGVAPGQTWYVGDNFDRDVVAGRRAGVGAAILMEARSTYRVPYTVRETPDAVVAEPAELTAMLTSSLASTTTGGAS
ncbi:HAD-IA family hydrolase [Nocardioides sp. YIM 152315]|uniref:HAD family hydrolase n=1 Tax=Nocardioides sp. YIM 152315 TaxID=3031760 RepID=UPI0023DC388B|nr:HAD-IA family hydrolase [Nocardioides sp. YIM 152315]MDF1605479.1 HAD-IA family hydrolase [Nocardioides sp. YIM 152315]